MGDIRRRVAFPILALAMLFLATTVAAQPTRTRGRNVESPASALQKRDSLKVEQLSSFDDMAHRVDSLQFIVVYNAELLQKDISTKVMWIYVMLGAMILASITMYSALRQAQRTRNELEEKLTAQLASAVSHLESEIKSVKDKVDYYHPKPPRRTSKKKSRSSRSR